VVAVAILSACFMQEVSGVFVVSSAPVNSATLKPEAKIELKEETQVLDEDNEKIDDTDNEEDEEQDDTEDEEQDDAQDKEQDEVALIATNEQDEKVNEEDEEQDDADDEDQDEEQDEEQGDTEVEEQDDAEDETRNDEVQKRVAGMSQSVQKLYIRAEELVTQTDKGGTSTEANRAADQAVKDFSAAFDKELGSEAKLGEQGNEKVEKNEEEAVSAKASQSKDADKLYARVAELVKESKKDGASDEVKKAAHEAVKQLGLGKD